MPIIKPLFQSIFFAVRYKHEPFALNQGFCPSFVLSAARDTSLVGGPARDASLKHKETIISFYFAIFLYFVCTSWVNTFGKTIVLK